MSKEAQKTLQEKRLAFLNDTLAYYEADPANRRNAVPGRALGVGGECTYAPQHAGTEGCAIGRHIPLALAKRFDSITNDTSVSNPIVFNRLHDVLKELGKVFLGDMQRLHDRSWLWLDNDCQPGTAAERRANYVASFKKDYNLE